MCRMLSYTATQRYRQSSTAASAWQKTWTLGLGSCLVGQTTPLHRQQIWVSIFRLSLGYSSHKLSRFQVYQSYLHQMNGRRQRCDADYLSPLTETSQNLHGTTGYKWTWIATTISQAREEAMWFVAETVLNSMSHLILPLTQGTAGSASRYPNGIAPK